MLIMCHDLYASTCGSADICKEDGPGQMRAASGKGGKYHFLRTFFMHEPISCDLSRNLSRKNAKP